LAGVDLSSEVTEKQMSMSSESDPVGTASNSAPGKGSGESVDPFAIVLSSFARQRIQTGCLVVLAVLASTYLIYWLRPVLVPFVVSLFVVSGLSPILSLLERTLGVSRIIAAAIAFLAGLALMVVFGLSIWVSVSDLGRNSGAYTQRVEDIVREIEERSPIKVSLSGGIAGVAGNGSDPQNPPELAETLVRQGISQLSTALVSLVSTSIMVLIFVFFLLLGGPSVIAANPTVIEINEQIRSYLSLKTSISVFTGLLFGVALELFGVPMAFTFGVLAFLLNYVPNIGPIVASILPIPLIIFDPEGSIWWMAAVITVTSTIQMISGNVVEPKMMGASSDLHPVVVLLALMFWGMMWGIVGMFLATPIASGFKIVLERFDETRPIANLMAGR
jgi:AI-2 transport protein TqsA